MSDEPYISIRYPTGHINGPYHWSVGCEDSDERVAGDGHSYEAACAAAREALTRWSDDGGA